MSTMGSTFQLRPTWTFLTKIGAPFQSDADVNGKKVTRGVLEFALPFSLFLDTLFDGEPIKGRSAGEEQHSLFKWMETAYGMSGLDGKSCLLRMICELQSHPIGEFSMLGELLTILLTPRADDSHNLLDDYIAAEKIGRSSTKFCFKEYAKCPFSVFDYFNRPPDQEQSYAGDNPANNEVYAQ